MRTVFSYAVRPDRNETTIKVSVVDINMGVQEAMNELFSAVSDSAFACTRLDIGLMTWTDDYAVFVVHASLNDIKGPQVTALNNELTDQSFNSALAAIRGFQG